MAEKKKKAWTQVNLAGLTPAQRRMYDFFFWASPVNMQDPEATELTERTNQYIQICYDENIVPMWSDYAVACCIDRATLTRYRDGIAKCPAAVRQTLMRVHRWMEAALTQAGFNNPMYTSYVIWLQKNHFGFKDSVDINVQQAQLVDQSAQDVINRRNFILDSVAPPLEDHNVVDTSFTVLNAQNEPVTAVEDAGGQQDTKAEEEP